MENQNAKHKLAQNGEVCTDNVKRLEIKVLDVANRDKMKTKKIPKNEFSLNAIPRDEQKCIPACHTFYMSYDKNVKRMASMHICLHTSLHGYFFIKLQLHFHTTMNQYVNKSIRQRIIEASKKRPFSTKGISPSIELQDNVCFLFCSVQSLDDGITKLCRTIRV